MSALINEVTNLPIARVPSREFINPLWMVKPFRHGVGESAAYDAEYQSLLPQFVNNRLKFMHLGKRYTLLRTHFWDPESDDDIKRYELLINGREVDVSRLVSHFIDDDGETMADWLDLPYKWKETDHHVELSTFVAKLCSMYRMHPDKSGLLIKYEPF